MENADIIRTIVTAHRLDAWDGRKGDNGAVGTATLRQKSKRTARQGAFAAKGEPELLFAGEHSGKASRRDAGRAGLAAIAHASDRKILILGAATDPMIGARRILARPGQFPAPSPMGGT